MNETREVQKQDIDRAISELRQVGNLLRELCYEIAWATRNDPSPTAEAKRLAAGAAVPPKE